jgi:hypothetical protein
MEKQPNQYRKASFEIKDFLKAMRDWGLAALTKLNKSEQVQVVNWAQDVFDQYASVVEQYPHKIKDLAALPFEKDEIKTAIKTLLPAYLEKGSEDLLNELKDKYVGLGAFQKIDQTESVLIDLIISEQKVLLEDITAYLIELKMLREK